MSKAYGSILAIFLTLFPLRHVQASDNVMYQEITDNKPEVGVSATVYLGDRMLKQRRGEWQECIIPKFDNLERIMGVPAFIVKKGQPLCKPTMDAKFYNAQYVNYPDSRAPASIPVLIKQKGSELKVCMSYGGVAVYCTKGKTHVDFDTKPYFVYTVNSIQQTIEYAGRSGDVLKFTYSEFADDYARQAFTREFQVDLTQGKVAAYKGAIIEIESATNSSITYKVVRNFQQ
jgi:hypothetical protein